MTKITDIARTALPVLAALLLGTGAAAAQECCSKELVEAANKEGKLVLYTALLLDSEQIVMKEFNKKFPKVKVDIVRAPGARLFTRIETEAAAGKLGADVIDLTDLGLAKRPVERLRRLCPAECGEVAEGDDDLAQAVAAHGPCLRAGLQRGAAQQPAQVLEGHDQPPPTRARWGW